MNKNILILLIVVINCTCALGQEVIKNQHLWNTAIGDVKFNDNWAFNSEIHVRFTNHCKDVQQYLLIPGITYKVKKEIQLSTGFTYFKNYPHGKYPLVIPLSENALWQQITFIQKIGKVSFFHRFRTEQRFTQKLDVNPDNIPFVNGRVYANRLRYRILINRPIALKERLYLLAFEEIWLNMSNSFSPVSMNQNLFYAGTFYKLNDGLKLGLGYMNQVLNRGQNLRENNSMLSLLCLYKIRSRSKSKSKTP